MEDRPQDFSLEESSDDTEGWISWFCDLEGHEFFIEVLIAHNPRWKKTIFETHSISMGSNRRSRTISKP